jgi:hypothetical protein
MSWQEEGRKLAEGKWVRFTPEKPARTLTFVEEPKKVKKEVQQGERKGEKFEQLSFPVEEDGESRVLEPNRSLLTQLLDEDNIESIVGRTFFIKCLDLTSKRNWSIRPVGKQADVTRTWTGEDKDTDKAKFMEGVEQKKKKRTRKPKVEPEEVADVQDDQSQSQADGEPES